MRIILTAILTASITAPAAVQYSPPMPPSPSASSVAPMAAMPAPSQGLRRGAGAYAQYPGVEQPSSRSANDVYVNGVYVSSDPDLRVRNTLRREFISDSLSR